LEVSEERAVRSSYNQKKRAPVNEREEYPSGHDLCFSLLDDVGEEKTGRKEKRTPHSFVSGLRGEEGGWPGKFSLRSRK